MSEQNINAPSITSVVKEKDPRRVGAGKRLGAISRQAKEARRLEREAQAQAQSGEMEADNKYTLYLFGGLVMARAASYLYLNKNDNKKLSTTPEEKEEQLPPKRNSRCVFSK